MNLSFITSFVYAFKELTQKINDVKCDHCWLQKKRLPENRLKIHIDIKKLFSIYVRFYCYCCNDNVIFLYLLHVVIYLFLAILKKPESDFVVFVRPTLAPLEWRIISMLIMMMLNDVTVNILGTLNLLTDHQSIVLMKNERWMCSVWKW